MRNDLCLENEQVMKEFYDFLMTEREHCGGNVCFDCENCNTENCFISIYKRPPPGSVYIEKRDCFDIRDCPCLKLDYVRINVNDLAKFMRCGWLTLVPKKKKVFEQLNKICEVRIVENDNKKQPYYVFLKIKNRRLF